jgi:radical SAM protein with 4Fe4S-binding SPASM domain
MQGSPYNFFIQWHVTERCNLKCRHCYQNEVLPEMTFTQICDGISNICNAIESWKKEYNIDISPVIHFTGGEPLIRRDIFQIIRHAQSSGLSVSLMSNGTLITDEIARQLKENGIKDIQISLDGLEEVHDSIRGKGSFQRTVRGIEKLIKSGVDTNINLTLSRLNSHQLPGMIKLAEDIGISAVSFSRLVPCGSGSTLIKDMLTSQEINDIYHHFHNYGNNSVEVISRDPLAIVSAYQEEIPDVDFPIGGCAAGVFGITITSDGSIMPCRRMDLVIGNITEQSFRELWAESDVLWSLRSREAYKGNCGKCLYWAICRGCRAVALAVSRQKGNDDYLADDPQCGFFREH